VSAPAPELTASQPVAQMVALSRRAILAMARQPATFFPALFFPTMLAAVNAAAFNRSTNLPGFPEVDSFLDFLLPAVIMQGVLFGGVAGGNELAVDIEDGFFERLLASPVWRPSILVGRLAGSATLGGFQAIFFTTLLGVFGARVKGGIGGIVVLVLVAMIMAVAVGGITTLIAIRTGSQEAVQNTFPLVFILVFLSSAFFPTQLMTGWYQQAARINPLTWVIDGIRHLVITGWSWSEAAQAILVSVGLAAITISLAGLALRRRLRSS
jgi:ABC-2 type transport system permease protein